MKVFLSWSGELSHGVARVFAQMLPVLLEDVKPFEASEDIEKGKRWNSTLATVLSECSYGIVCLTRSNLSMPWILFEAGALSKLDTSHVAPFLLGLKPSEVKSPLADFQITSYDEPDVKRLIKSINASLDRPRADANLEKAWQMWWPAFKAQIDALDAEVNQDVHEPRRDVSVTNQETLEEILGLVREQRRLLSSPETLLPPQYLASMIRSLNSGENDPRNVEIAYTAILLLRTLLFADNRAGGGSTTNNSSYQQWDDLASLALSRLTFLIPDPRRMHVSAAQVNEIARGRGDVQRARMARMAEADEFTAHMGWNATVADAEEQAAVVDDALSAAVADPEGQL